MWKGDGGVGPFDLGGGGGPAFIFGRLLGH